MEKEAVADSSSIVFLAKLDIFNLAKNMFSKLIVPKQVVKELFAKETPEIAIIQRELDNFVKEVEVKLTRDIPLDDGERYAINCCLENKINRFVCDDKKARRFARTLNIETVGIIGILLWNLEHKNIEKGEFKLFISKLINNGYYMSSDLYQKVMELSDAM